MEPTSRVFFSVRVPLAKTRYKALRYQKGWRIRLAVSYTSCQSTFCNYFPQFVEPPGLPSKDLANIYKNH